MNLFLLENDSSVESIREMHSENDVVVCFNQLVYERLASSKRAKVYVFVDDLFHAEDFDVLHEATDQFALNWFMDKGQDYSLFQGVSYGDLIKITFSRLYMVTPLVKYGEAIRKALEKWPNVDVIFHDFSAAHSTFYVRADDQGRFFNKHRLVESVARQLGRKVQYLKPPTEIPPAIRGKLEQASRGDQSWKGRAKRLFETFLNLTNAAVGLCRQRPRRIYLFPYDNTRSIFRYLSNKFVLPEIANDLVRPRFFVNGPVFRNLETLPYRLNQEECAFLKSFRETYERLSPKLVVRSIDYTQIYAPVFDHLFKAKVPALLTWVGKVRAETRRLNIRTMVVIEEIDEMQKATIAACQSEGAQAVFIDHGIQGMRCLQRVCERTKSDVVVVPSEYYAEEYRRQSGSRPRKFEILGNPSLDPYAVRPRKRVDSIRKVLFLSFEDSFYGSMNRFSKRETYHQQVFIAARQLIERGYEVYYRPHPGESDEYHEYLFRYFGLDQAQLRYSRGIPFREQIYEMDLLVCNISSCFYESQLAGVPAIFLEPRFDPRNFYAPMSGENGKDILRVETGNELVSLIDEFREHPEKATGFLDRFLSTYAPYYLGDLKLNSGKRIAEYLSLLE